MHKNMAEVVDALETIAVVSERNSSLIQSVKPCLGQDNERRKGDVLSKSVIADDRAKKVRFESVNLEDDDDTDEDGDDEDDDDTGKENRPKKKRLKKKKPKHIVVEDDSSSDDDATGATSMNVNPSDLSWLLWMWYYITAVSSGALKAAEFLGEKLAAFFGITTPKYQYVIDEYYRLKELEREEEEKEQKEKELLAQRRLKDLARVEGGDGSVVLDEVSNKSVQNT